MAVQEDTWHWILFHHTLKQFETARSRWFNYSASHFHFFTGQDTWHWDRSDCHNYDKDRIPSYVQLPENQVLMYFPKGITLSQVPILDMTWDFLTNSQAWTLQVNYMRMRAKMGEQLKNIKWIGEPTRTLLLTDFEWLNWIGQNPPR